MRFPKTLAALAMACAFPALAQYASGTLTPALPIPTTSITGGLGDNTYSASGVVINPAQDQVLLRQVLNELASSPAMAGAQIDVQVVGGRVTLNGIALGPAQAENAKSIAQGVAGAANVSSNLSTSRQ